MKKINNIFILVRCLIYFLIHGASKRAVSSPANIIILQNAKLGDMVCTTPVFRVLKEKYPNSRICVIGSKVNRELLANNTDVDEYIVFDRNITEISRRLKEKKPDLGCVMVPDFLGLALLCLAGAKTIIAPRMKKGYCPTETRLYKFLTRFVITRSYSFGEYVPGLYLKLLEPAGVVSSNTTKKLGFSIEAKNFVDGFLKNNNISVGERTIIGVSLSAGNIVKLWPVDRFAKVIEYLLNKYGVFIFIIGSAADREYSNKLPSHIKDNPQVKDITGLFDIDQLKGFISNLDLFISVDTGPIYIAEAFGVPTIDIVGPIDEREQPPIGPKNLIVGRPEMVEAAIHVLNAHVHTYNESIRKEARRQTEMITEDMVIRAIDKFFS